MQRTRKRAHPHPPTRPLHLLAPRPASAPFTPQAQGAAAGGGGDAAAATMAAIQQCEPAFQVGRRRGRAWSVFGYCKGRLGELSGGSI